MLKKKKQDIYGPAMDGSMEPTFSSPCLCCSGCIEHSGMPDSFYCRSCKTFLFGIEKGDDDQAGHDQPGDDDFKKA